MAKLLCPNITSDQNRFSDPVPIIGVYIAGATLVCFLLMFCDVINRIRFKKPWLPCRFFSLNSVTLTLLSIVAKLPVDLTTSMPSALDQLSKVTGTTLICVSMCFLFPSFGASRASECFTNMVALTILVITVIVNICIQMSTGVIFSFVVEHTIIMFITLALLLFLWVFAWEIEFHKEMNTDRNKDLFSKGTGNTSMLQRLKLCYLHGYNSNPQIVPYKSQFSLYVYFLSLLCLVVVLQVTFRSLISHEFEFCNGLSDYGWSIRIIVATQILVILLANVATGFRWISMFPAAYSDMLNYVKDKQNFSVIARNIPFLGAQGNSLAVFRGCLYLVLSPMVFVCMLPLMVVVATYLPVDAIVKRYGCFMYNHSEFEGIQGYTDLLRENNLVLENWILRKCVGNIKKWTSAKKNDSLSHVTRLLSKTSPSHESLEQLNSWFNFREGNEVSCLYLVFLVRIASVSTPSKSDHQIQSLNEVFDIIHFVDTKINSSRFNNRKKCELAKAMWVGKDFRSLLPKIVERISNKPYQPQSDIDRALEVIKELKDVLPSSFIWDEVGIIMDLISGREYTSVEELYEYMEQLFVDMLHIFLIQLPNAIFKEVIDSHVEEYEEKVKLMLKLLWKIESLEGIVPWSFPVGSNITCLRSTEAPIAGHRSN